MLALTVIPVELVADILAVIAAKQLVVKEKSQL